MRKSIKKFLIISQVLGWSTLVASACTNNQVKTTMQSNVNNNNAQDSGTNKQKDDSQELPDNQVVKLTKVGIPLTYTLSEGHQPADGPKPNGEKNMNTARDHQEDKVNNAEGSSVTSSSGGESGHNPSGPTNNPQANPQASQKSEPAGGKGMGGSDGSHQGQAEDSSSEGSIPGAADGVGQKGDAKATSGQESTPAPHEPKKET